jgi:hypothetical protein
VGASAPTKGAHRIGGSGSGHGPEQGAWGHDPQRDAWGGSPGDPAAPPEYLAVGHLTTDLLPDGAAAPGGTVYYATLAAARLGYRAAMLTAATSWEAVPAAVAVASAPSRATSTFAHIYAHGRREQLVRAVAAPITAAQIPESWRAAPLVHIGPVIDECDPELVFAFPDALIGVTPQGWMRRLRGPLPAPMEPRRWEPPAALLRRIDLLVLSVEDVAGDEALVAAYAAECPVVALTRGADGLTLFIRGAPHHVPAFPVESVDTNGAGDVFAAAMLIHLFETGDPLRAARFAALAAALAVEGRGSTHIPGRAAIVRRGQGWLPLYRT